MEKRILVPLYGEEVAPRFDLATEVWLAQVDEAGAVASERVIVLSQAGAEDLCQLILAESVDVVICGGVEAEFYDYLCWKRVEVRDDVVAGLDQVRRELAAGGPRQGEILMPRRGDDA